MKDWKTYFKGKKVTLMGLGLLGRGIGDAKFLAEEGSQLIVTDLKSEEELKSSITELKDFPNITFHLGGHVAGDFHDRDFVLKAAGVPADSPFIVEARKNKVPIEMSTSLFAKLSPAMIVGVTGTRGKSTVTHLVHEVLKNSYKSGRVFLGGNVRGVSTLPFLREATAADIVVMELDSWQLQGYAEAGISPHVSIFTTFYPDHLNYYKGDRDAYLTDKAAIFISQTEKDFLIVGQQCADVVTEKYPDIKSHVEVVNEKSIPDNWHLRIPGAHNRYDAALAVAALRRLGISEEEIKNGIENFTGVPGRLEFLKEVRGVKIYNDTTATTPEATTAALEALGNEKNIVLIMGGADKNLDMTGLLKILPKNVKSLILLPGTGTLRIRNEIKDVEIVDAETLAETVEKGMQIAQSGDVLLLSPAFASFGLFKNEFDRGEQFVTLVNNLTQ